MLKQKLPKYCFRGVSNFAGEGQESFHQVFELSFEE